MLAPASSFEVIDTWHSTGLAGSGGNDFAARDLFVPEAHTLASDPAPTRSAPLYCYFGMFLASWHGVALGLARRAIDAALAVAEKKIHIFPPPPILLRDRPHARVALAKAEMELGAARAFTLRDDRPHLGQCAGAGAGVGRESAGDGVVARLPKRAPDCAVDVRPRRTDGRVAQGETGSTTLDNVDVNWNMIRQ
jgi:alkylation response protein AidB-like acyl-CoA dehydrogenase